MMKQILIFCHSLFSKCPNGRVNHQLELFATKACHLFQCIVTANLLTHFEATQITAGRRQLSLITFCKILSALVSLVEEYYGPWGAHATKFHPVS